MLKSVQLPITKKNKCLSNYYHENEHWNNMTLCAESFAHFYEVILIDSGQEKEFKRIFPNAFKLFEELFRRYIYENKRIKRIG